MQYYCLKLCDETSGCVAITFKESANTCWLKSSIESEPKANRSFVTLGCLKEPENVLYPEFREKLWSFLKMDMTCTHGYSNLVPTDSHCFRFVTNRHQVDQGQVDANRACVLDAKGGLSTINSKELRDAHVRELSRLKLKQVLVRLQLKLGKYL